MLEDRNTIADCLNSLKLKTMAKDAVKSKDCAILNKYVDIIVNRARKEKREDILEQLWACGLTY